MPGRLLIAYLCVFIWKSHRTSVTVCHRWEQRPCSTRGSPNMAHCTPCYFSPCVPHLLASCALWMACTSGRTWCGRSVASLFWEPALVLSWSVPWRCRSIQPLGFFFFWLQTTRLTLQIYLTVAYFPCGLAKVAIYLWDSKVLMAAFCVCNARIIRLLLDLCRCLLIAHVLPCYLGDVLHGCDPLWSCDLIHHPWIFLFFFWTQFCCLFFRFDERGKPSVGWCFPDWVWMLTKVRKTTRLLSWPFKDEMLAHWTLATVSVLLAASAQNQNWRPCTGTRTSQTSA